MAKRNPKAAPLTRAGRELRQRQAEVGPRKAKQLQTEQLRAEPAESRHGPTSAPESAIQAPPAPRFTFPPLAEPVPAPPEPAAGTYRIDQLRLGQCRFACTPHDAASHRFCGQPTEIGPGNAWGAWCAEHLPIVTCAPGRSAGGSSKADVAKGAGPDRVFTLKRQGAWRGFGVARHRDLGGEA